MRVCVCVCAFGVEGDITGPGVVDCVLLEREGTREGTREEGGGEGGKESNYTI